jgi:hypothetical protein
VGTFVLLYGVIAHNTDHDIVASVQRSIVEVRIRCVRFELAQARCYKNHIVNISNPTNQGVMDKGANVVLYSCIRLTVRNDMS